MKLLCPQVYQYSFAKVLITIFHLQHTSLQLRKETDKLVICGQALSHCVNYTARDIVEHWPKVEMDKLTVLEDCSSSVPGFEAAGEQFLSDMKEAGVNVETSETFQC